MPRSRSFTRFTIRVDLPHLGQSVLLECPLLSYDPQSLQSLPFFSPDMIYVGTAALGCPALLRMCGVAERMLDWTAEGVCPYACFVSP